MSLAHIKYPKIEALVKHKDILTAGNFLTVREKLDGANASIRFDEHSGLIYTASRNRLEPLDSMSFRGFPEYIKERRYALLDFFSSLTTQYILFGEWLVKHKINYGENFNHFYLFDVYEIASGEFLPTDYVERVAETLEFRTPHIFYQGVSRGANEIIERCQEWCGISLDAEPGAKGEGLVISCPTYKPWGTPQRVKLVTEDFKETKATKTPRPNTSEDDLAEKYVTHARVCKRALDLCPREDWDKSLVGKVIQSVTHDIFEECMLDIAKDTDTLNFKPFKKAIANTTRRLFFDMLLGDL
jgi:hypothetical protein